MPAFLKHNPSINPLGEHIKEARLNRGISLKKASQDLNIASKYLEALESQEPRLTPNQDYFDRWLALYISYLGLSEPELEKLKSGQSANVASNSKKQNLFSLSEWFSRLLVLAAVSGLVIFLLYRVNAIFSPPRLEIFSPIDGTVSYQRQLLVSGSTAKEAELVINNKAVFVDQEGEFETYIDLQSGLNLIKITAQKRYSRPKETEIRVLFGD